MRRLVNRKQIPLQISFSPFKILSKCCLTSKRNLFKFCLTLNSGLPTEIAQLPEPVHQRKVFCYPVQMAVPPGRLPHVVELTQENEQHILKFRGDTIKINSSHFYKLVSYDNTSC